MPNRMAKEATEIRSCSRGLPSELLQRAQDIGYAELIEQRQEFFLPLQAVGIGQASQSRVPRPPRFRWVLARTPCSCSI